VSDTIISSYVNGDESGWFGEEVAAEQWPVMQEAANFVEFDLFGDVQAPKYSENYRVAQRVLGRSIGGASSVQLIGDCFPAGTMIRMADGTEKPIEAVQIGDKVISHFGKSRVVTDTIAKDYDGDLVYVRGKGSPREVGATPDHQFVQVNVPRNCRQADAEFVWMPVGEWKDQSHALLPTTLGEEKQTVFTTGDGKAIELDSRMGRLIGLFLAEGSIDKNHHGPYRVRFSFGRHEVPLVEEVCGLAKELFGLDASARNLPSKPSVTLVDISNVNIARLFDSLIPGNVYTKRVPACVRTSPRSVRFATIKGWIDGDGHSRVDEINGGLTAKTVGVSASIPLLQDMYELCLSCDLKPNLNFRKVRVGNGVKTRQPSGQVALYGESALAFCPELREKAFSSGKRKPWAKRGDMTELGMAVKTSVVRRESLSGKVFCLEIEEDHSFIANGYAVHNCVSWGMKHAVEYLACCDILMRKDAEEFHHIFAPYIYGVSRVQIGGGRLSGDGSLGSWAAAGVMKYGVIFADKNETPVYSKEVAKKWGADGPPSSYLAVGKNYLVQSAAKVKSWDQLVAGLANGYSCTVASNQGFTMKPNKDGFHQADGQWMHQMCIYDYCLDPEPHVLIANSWGDVHGRLKHFSTGEELPGGTIRAKKAVIERMIGQGDTFLVSQYNGFPTQDIPAALFKLVGR
jgi:hypothetical protein